MGRIGPRKQISEKLKAPKAHNIPTWGNAPGWMVFTNRGLKARHPNVPGRWPLFVWCFFPGALPQANMSPRLWRVSRLANRGDAFGVYQWCHDLELWHHFNTAKPAQPQHEALLLRSTDPIRCSSRMQSASRLRLRGWAVRRGIRSLPP